jgi:hypothetical protein
MSEQSAEARAVLEANLVEWLHEHDPMCGHEDCIRTARKLAPVVEAYAAAKVEEAARVAEEMAQLAAEEGFFGDEKVLQECAAAIRALAACKNGENLPENAG